MELNIEKSNFTKYSLEKISKALQVGLSNNYKVVEVSIVDCPNLRNWGCPSEGISGNQKIIDVGGEPYMHDPNFIGAEFDYEEISKINECIFYEEFPFSIKLSKFYGKETICSKIFMSKRIQLFINA
mgnify:CR=1 FL=1